MYLRMIPLERLRDGGDLGAGTFEIRARSQPPEHLEGAEGAMTEGRLIGFRRRAERTR
jgi:hypothetical protein